MAALLWGQVYYKDQFAGYLRQEPGERTSFVYDSTYVDSRQPAIAYHLPLRVEPYIHTGLLPFFDNLIAEGWLEQAQARLLGKRIVSRFELLLAFGFDCAGAVSVLDPEPAVLADKMLNLSDSKEAAVLTNRASLSGVQPKLSLIENKGKLRPSRFNELSTHIAKFASREHSDLVVNEFLTMRAFQALLPNDAVAELRMGEVENVKDPALIIKRFDRFNGQRLHFEEFNQLLNLPATMKYEGAYKDLADFMINANQGLTTEIYRLFLRILAGLLLGNTDMHFKNFAMFHTENGLRLTPSYDQVAAALYDYKTVALALAGARNVPIEKLKARSIIRLGKEFKLSNDAIHMAVKQLGNKLEQAAHAIASASTDNALLKNQLIQLMRKKWNGIFALVGKALLTKP